MSSLIEFLEARIAEDEATANAVLVDNPLPWQTDLMEWVPNVFTGRLDHRGRQSPLCWAEDSGTGEMDAETAIYFAANNPGRVLAECAAKRQIIELHTEHLSKDGFSRCECCCSGPYAPEDGELWPCRTLRALAAPYASHPAFDSAWAGVMLPPV